MTWEIYLVYLATVAVFFAAPPGSSQILMISNSLRHGVKPSLWTRAGDLSANTLQILAAGFGLAAIIGSAAGALTVIKWLGVAYLVWYGIRIFLAPAPSLDRTDPANRPAPRKLYLQGFLASAANPEAVVFFAALFPQFLTHEAPLAPQLVILGATYLVVDGAILVLMGAGAERVLGGLRRKSRLLNSVAGLMMIAAATLLGAKDVRAR